MFFLGTIISLQHSMIYFFHHYEMPQILYQERLQRLFSEIEAMPVSFATYFLRLMNSFPLFLAYFPRGALLHFHLFIILSVR